MIQSDKFDSSHMDIKKLANSLINFIIKRLIELVGIIISCLGILLFIALISYSPNDPNFIFPENTEINNILGFQGSYVSDLFFQSIGFIAFLIPITYIFTGINIFRKKGFFLLIQNSFYIILYLLPGSLLFTLFYKDTFTLYINGSGGFVGNYFNKLLLPNNMVHYENIYFYTLILLVIILFSLSINLNLKNIFFSFKKLNQLIFRKKDKNYTNENEIINEYIPQEEIKNLIQEDLPFIKSETNKMSGKIKFKLPSIDLLKIPSKKERTSLDKDENNDPKFLEKILLDF